MACANADTPATIQSSADAEEAVLCLINEQRAAKGVPPLTPNQKLRAAALLHAQDAKSLKWWAGGGSKVHTNPVTGSTPESRIKDAGYCPGEVAPLPATNENCYSSSYKGGVQFQGGTTPRAAVTWWMKSQLHRDTLLDPLYGETGVAVLLGVAETGGDADKADGGAIFVQTFGGCAVPELPKVGHGWAWGMNNVYQLGDGTTIDRLKPVQPQGLSGVVAVAGGFFRSLALNDDGSVWAWGWNAAGALGDGSASGTKRATPVQVGKLSSGVVAIASGVIHSLALTDDGSVWAWGKNDSGQLGDGTTTDRREPQQLPNIGGVVAIAAGANHSLAVTTDRVVLAWGRNDSGQLGDGTTTDRLRPVSVEGLEDVRAIAGGGRHSLALDDTGEVWAWGMNHNGQLGDSTLLSRFQPGKVHMGTGHLPIVAIAAGTFHSLAISQATASAYTWGGNAYGELGSGVHEDQWLPGGVTLLSDWPSRIPIALDGGWGHSLALMSDGSVWAWGRNDHGQLGDGTTISRARAQPVANVSGVVGIACGLMNSLTP